MRRPRLLARPLGPLVPIALLALLVLPVLLVSPSAARTPEQTTQAASQTQRSTSEPPAVPLFNGRDLTGWFNISCAPDTWTVRDGMIHSTGQPICELRTERMYENFILELEYQHLKAGGNAGVFVWADALPARGQPFLRAIEVQVLDGQETANYTSHGDVFAIHGARLTPDRPHPAGWMRSLPRERRAKPAGQWNHYRITCRNGTITLAVNGAEVSGGTDVSPRKGYIALESEGSPTLFRNLRITELPSSGTLTPDQIASADNGLRSIYNGQTLDGWRVVGGAADRWTTKDWILTHPEPAPSASASEREYSSLVTTAEHGDFMLVVDWRLPAPAASASSGSAKPGAAAPASARKDVRLTVTPAIGSGAPAQEWNRSVFTLRGNRLTLTVNGETILDSVPHETARRGRIALAPAGAAEFANIFIKRLD